MNSVTICPNYFILRENLTPDEIQNSYIYPLSIFLDNLNEKNIELILESNILEIIQTKFPWSLYEDNEWKGYIKDWQIILFSKIGKICKYLIDSSGNVVNQNYNCTHNVQEINVLFSKFLLDFGSVRLNNGNYSEGIYIHESCSNKNNFFNFNNISDLKKVEFPWLQIYDNRLPRKGHYPFIPPQNWKINHVIAKGHQHGFIDSDGSEWCWDRLHQNHWDVQHLDGTYTNVNPEGKII